MQCSEVTVGNVSDRRQELNLLSANPETHNKNNHTTISKNTVQHVLHIQLHVTTYTSAIASVSRLFCSDFLENTMVILHFHPPFSLAKKHSLLYMK